MAKGFVYLVAVMDWFSRRVLAWRLSIGMDTDFCVEALQEATERFGQPEVFNTDQGVQFTSAAFLDELEGCGVPWTAKAGFSTTSSLKGCGAA
jgi:putative transposase